MEFSPSLTKGISSGYALRHPGPPAVGLRLAQDKGRRCQGVWGSEQFPQ